MKSKYIYFISHPDVEIDANIPVTRWGLSDKGRARFQSFLSESLIANITSVYCSDEQKAIDGAQMLADHLDLNYQIIAELGENDRSSTGYLVAEEFEHVANQFFANPDTSVRGWETANDAQQRIVQAVTEIGACDQSDGSVAIISHGAVGTLLYCYLNNHRIDRRWDQPGTGGGNMLKIELGAVISCTWWQPIDQPLR